AAAVQGILGRFGRNALTAPYIDSLHPSPATHWNRRTADASEPLPSRAGGRGTPRGGLLVGIGPSRTRITGRRSSSFGTPTRAARAGVLSVPVPDPWPALFLLDAPPGRAKMTPLPRARAGRPRRHTKPPARRPHNRLG